VEFLPLAQFMQVIAISTLIVVPKYFLLCLFVFYYFYFKHIIKTNIVPS